MSQPQYPGPSSPRLSANPLSRRQAQLHLKPDLNSANPVSEQAESGPNAANWLDGISLTETVAAKLHLESGPGLDCTMGQSRKEIQSFGIARANKTIYVAWQPVTGPALDSALRPGGQSGAYERLGDN